MHVFMHTRLAPHKGVHMSGFDFIVQALSPCAVRLFVYYLVLGKNNDLSEGELCASCKDNCEGHKRTDIMNEEIATKPAKGKSGSWQALGSSEMGIPGKCWADPA